MNLFVHYSLRGSKPKSVKEQQKTGDGANGPNKKERKVRKNSDERECVARPYIETKTLVPTRTMGLSVLAVVDSLYVARPITVIVVLSSGLSEVF